MECFLGLEFNGDTAASEREEAAERMSVRDLRKKLAFSIGCLELKLVEATENENGDGVGSCG